MSSGVDESLSRGEVPLPIEPKRWSVVVSGVMRSCTAVDRPYG
jgi:hypothetical protein